MRFSDLKAGITGLAVPVSSLRTKESEGIGDFLDLIPLGRFCAKAGLGIIQILPVNDTGLQSSPYSALSAFALHPAYLRISAIPEAKGFENEIRDLQDEFETLPRIPFAKVLNAKMDLLKSVYEKNSSGLLSDASILKWIGSNSWIRPYAAFCLLKARFGNASWKEWRESANPESGRIEALWADQETRGELVFFAWLQCRLEEQFLAAACELRSMGVLLKGDLPILMNEDSVEVWSKRKIFKLDSIAGAPPDMFAALGQNWGFPVYDWDALEAEGHSFWKERLAQAGKFYDAYRIDHVLGFFRIWALSERDRTGYLGRFLPSISLSSAELAARGFSPDRIRWLSEPHIRTEWLEEALRGLPNPQGEMDSAIRLCLSQIGNEELFLFSRSVRGEKDIEILELRQETKNYLSSAWRNRVLLPCAHEHYVPTWNYRDTWCWPTLGQDERSVLERLFDEKRNASEALWEETGRKVLSVLRDSSSMLPCAEDLGAVPDCVPRVLGELGILGLRILRWTRKYKEPGEPYLPLSAYPEASVCTPSCHDTSCLREWWELEPGREELWAFLGGKGSCPDKYTPGTAAFILGRLSSVSSKLLMLQIQDLLHLSNSYYSDDPKEERVNVPGSWNDFNWSYRLPVAIEALEADGDLIRAVSSVTMRRR